MNNESEIEELNFEKILWGIFAFISILNIVGDDIEVKSIINNTSENTSTHIFTFTIVVTLLIYIYFVNRNKNQLNKAILNNSDIFLHGLRYVGSILLVIGVTFLLIFETNEKSPVGTPAA